jgi:hypothetical protein
LILTSFCLLGITEGHCAVYLRSCVSGIVALITGKTLVPSVHLYSDVDDIKPKLYAHPSLLYAPTLAALYLFAYAGRNKGRLKTVMDLLCDHVPGIGASQAAEGFYLWCL